MRHILQILLEELQNDLLKNVYSAIISQREKDAIATGIKHDIQYFCNYRRVPEYKKERKFVKHIENHLKNMDIKGTVICKICNKTISEIEEEMDDLDML